jgi:phage terminase large subunit
MTAPAWETIKRWRDTHDGPIEFVRENFGVEPDHWQKKALRAFISGDREMIRISLQACAGPGKSAVIAWCMWIFLSCFGDIGEHPKGAAVSITWDNLMDNLWVETNKWQQRSEYLKAAFTWTKTKIYANDHPDTWFISARSFPKSANKEELGKTLSGIHGKFVAFFIDESGAIPIEVAKAAEQAVGETIQNKGFVKVMQAGNPISLDGMLYAASQSDDTFIIRITGDPDDPDRSPRINAEWASDQIKKYGRDDPWVASYILGHFPKSALNTLLSVDEVLDAMNRTIPESAYIHAQKRLGVDVARFGMDSTIIFPRQGLAAFMYSEMRQARSDAIAARVANAKEQWGSENEFIDGTGGYGSGVVDSLIQGGFSPYEIVFSSKASDEKYYNIRSEMWFRMAKWVKRGGCVPYCNKLKKELSAPQYSFYKGKFRLEEKDQIKKRLGFSPDIADALALTFAIPDAPGRYSQGGRYNNKPHKAVTDYDPFKNM